MQAIGGGYILLLFLQTMSRNTTFFYMFRCLVWFEGFNHSATPVFIRILSIFCAKVVLRMTFMKLLNVTSWATLKEHQHPFYVNEKALDIPNINNSWHFPI